MSNHTQSRVFPFFKHQYLISRSFISLHPSIRSSACLLVSLIFWFDYSFIVFFSFYSLKFLLFIIHLLFDCLLSLFSIEARLSLLLPLFPLSFIVVPSISHSSSFSLFVAIVFYYGSLESSSRSSSVFFLLCQSFFLCPLLSPLPLLFVHLFSWSLTWERPKGEEQQSVRGSRPECPGV